MRFFAKPTSSVAAVIDAQRVSLDSNSFVKTKVSAKPASLEIKPDTRSFEKVGAFD
jgi:hypothetical protein